jgi:putative DNA primase/helicase
MTPDSSIDVERLLVEEYSKTVRSNGVPRDATAQTRSKTNVDDLACVITAAVSFARDNGGRLYAYQQGVYKPIGDRVICQRVKGLMQQWGLADKWTTRLANEVCEYIRVDCSELWTAPPTDTINVLNGLVDVRGRTLRPHTPDFYSAVQLPVLFDREARCPTWDSFVAAVFSADSEAIAWEILAWMMTPENSIQKAVLLLGEGSNGKSTFLRACVAFLGKVNTAALSLHKLEQDKFAAARLMGKLANICPDLPTAHLSSTSMFKALTGGDVLSAEYKFRDSFEYLPFCKLVFSANKAPQSDDATHGFFRRWQVVPFTRCFEEGATDTKNRDEMDASLSGPIELSGALNKALLAIAKIRRHGFTQTDSMREAWDDFRTATDPLTVWLDQNTLHSATAMVPKGELLAAFNRHLAEAGKPPMTKMAFGLAIKRARPAISEAQRTIKGRVQWVYTGIGFEENANG